MQKNNLPDEYIVQTLMTPSSKISGKSIRVETDKRGIIRVFYKVETIIMDPQWIKIYDLNNDYYLNRDES